MGQVSTTVGFKPNCKSMFRLNRQDINYLKRQGGDPKTVLTHFKESLGRNWALSHKGPLFEPTWFNRGGLKYLGRY